MTQTMAALLWTLVFGLQDAPGIVTAAAHRQVGESMSLPNIEDAPVLRAVIGKACEGRRAAVVVSNQSLSSKDFGSGIADKGSEHLSLLRRNETSSVLPTMPGCPGIQIVSKATIDAAFERDVPVSVQRAMRHPGWEGFYATFPKATALRHLSWPGYSPDGSRALVVGTAAGGLQAAAGCLYRLERTGATWRVVSVKTLWIG